MTFTIISANYANENHTAAVIISKEVGAVAISETDTPEEWKNFLSWDKENKIADYQSPMPPLPDPLADLIELLRKQPDAIVKLEEILK